MNYRKSSACEKDTKLQFGTVVQLSSYGKIAHVGHQLINDYACHRK